MGVLPVNTDTISEAVELFVDQQGKPKKPSKPEDHRKAMIRGLVSFGIVVAVITAGGTAWCVSTGNAIQDLFHKHAETTKAITDTRADMKAGFESVNAKIDKSNTKLDTLIGAVKGVKDIQP
jgi:hypothetical protein